MLHGFALCLWSFQQWDDGMIRLLANNLAFRLDGTTRIDYDDSWTAYVPVLPHYWVSYRWISYRGRRLCQTP